jgi:hypothetical protein
MDAQARIGFVVAGVAPVHVSPAGPSQGTDPAPSGGSE